MGHGGGCSPEPRFTPLIPRQAVQRLLQHRLGFGRRVVFAQRKRIRAYRSRRDRRGKPQDQEPPKRLEGNGELTFGMKGGNGKGRG